MYYIHNGWKLYTKEFHLKNHTKPHKIYFFSKRQPKSGIEVTIEDFHKMDVIVRENTRTGMPYIKKKR